MQPKANLNDLRTWMQENAVGALLIPHANMFQGEYIAENEDRLAWTLGFNGSAGFAIVTLSNAFLFVDSRYTLQAKKQSPEATILPLQEDSIQKIITEHSITSLWYDPWLLSAYDAKIWQKKLTMYPLEENPIDILWKDRPQSKTDDAVDYPVKFAGQTREEKILQLRQHMQKNSIKNWFIADPEIVCWLLNIRGNDVPCVPVAHAMALITLNEIIVFCDVKKIPKDFFKTFPIQLLPFSETVQTLKNKKDTIAAEEYNTPHALVLNNVAFSWKINPCLLWRAKKNMVQQEGMRNCHIRDALALLEFWQWLENNQNTTEIEAATHLDNCRAQQELFQNPSFITISAFGAHGAIVHYKSQPDTNIHLTRGLYLLDSGGQYLDGTTDITRTFAIGPPTAFEKKLYTLVLKGHIALSAIQFPASTTGAQLDALARQHLWIEGYDYGHGTGHGVGSYFNVHEGPQRISKAGATPLEIGMVLSNEPGVYLEGKFGIRLENLQIVIASNSGDFLCFEPLTLVPYDTTLIDTTLLNPSEINWLKTYYRTIWKRLSPYLDEKGRKWLKQKIQHYYEV